MARNSPLQHGNPVTGALEVVGAAEPHEATADDEDMSTHW